MKINNKIHKLGALLVILFLSTISFCVTEYKERQKNISDLRAELKLLNSVEEKKAAKNIIIKNEGVKFNDTFIPKTNSKDFKVLTVRLTVYWARGGDTDRDSARKKSSTGYTLKQGESIAVDPRIIPYTKEVIIPNVGLVKAVDTGTAVKEKKASNGKLPVIDIFFENKKDAMSFAYNNPKVVKVAILNNM
jgi:3D (Asp-Asp-Asp) domain-containing protein